MRKTHIAVNPYSLVSPTPLFTGATFSHFHYESTILNFFNEARLGRVQISSLPLQMPGLALISCLQVLPPVGNITALTRSIQSSRSQNLKPRVRLSCSRIPLRMECFRIIHEIETIPRRGLVDEVLKGKRFLALLIQPRGCKWITYVIIG